MGEPDKATREALAEAHRKSVKVVGRIAMTPTPPRDRLAEIERALEPFHAHDDFIDNAPNTAVVSITVTVGDLRAASAALTTLSEMRADMVGLAADANARITFLRWAMDRKDQWSAASLLPDDIAIYERVSKLMGEAQ